jgi:hypothetical protein
MAMNMSGQFKKFIDAGKANTRVLGPLERYLIAKPKDKSRRTDVLHPSEMVGSDWCHRASYFQLQGRPPAETRSRGLRLANVFAEGHLIHAKWQGWLHEMGVLYGRWYCIECEEFFWGGADCHDGPIEYREVPLFYQPLRIYGHADGWLVNLGDPMMLEIKSIGVGTLRFEAPELLAESNNDFDTAWRNINQPFMKHIQQVQVYMKLAELLNYDNVPQEAVIIYEAKPNQEVKEFVIPKSDFGISHLFDEAAMIMQCIKDQTPPPCNISMNGCAKCKGYENG